MSFDLKLIDGDLAIGKNGRLELVFNEEKIIQDVLKAIFTPTGSHSIHPWYGSPLQSKTIGEIDDPENTDSIITNAIVYSLKNLQMLQEMQEQDGQFLTPREQLSSIKDVSIFRDPVDQRKLSVVVSILLKSNETVKEGFIINI